MPEERRVALDLLDVRESIEEMGDQIRWIPTDHMLVDCMTKNMPPDAMLTYLDSMQYAFKYDDLIKNTKREAAKQRKASRQSNTPVLQNEETYTMYEAKEVNIIDNYDVYFHMFQYWYPDQPAAVTIPFRGDYQMLKQQCGYHDAYRILVTTLCPIG